MKTQSIQQNHASATQSLGVLQRKCDSCGNHTVAGGMCHECESKEGLLQRKSNGYSEPSEVPPIVHEVLNSAGRPLDAQTRAFFEPRFGHDFSRVRVHDDARAGESARAVSALAYTVGEHIAFAQGQYNLASFAGRSLLAHELAHAVQQRGMTATSGLGIACAGKAGDQLEAQADQAADLANGSVQEVALGRLAAPSLQRNGGPGTAYNIQLTYPPNHTERHEGLSPAAALSVLRNFANRVEAHLEGGQEGHRYLIEIHNDQYIVATVSDIFGGVSLPPLSVWDAPRAGLRRAREAIARGEIEEGEGELQRVAQQTRDAERLLYEYREGTVSGAERAVFGLEVVQVASAAVVTAGTGGTAGVLIGAGYAGAQRLAGEAARVHYGLQDSIDWGGVVFDTLFAAVAGRFGGQLGQSIAARLGGRITAQVASQLIVGRASGLAHAVARELFDGLRGRTQLTIEGFIDRLAEQLTLRAVFLDLVASAAGGATARGRGATEPSPAGSGTPPPAMQSRPPSLRAVPSPESSPPPRSAAGPPTPARSGDQVIDLGAARARRVGAASVSRSGSPSRGVGAFERPLARDMRVAPVEAAEPSARTRPLVALAPEPEVLAPPAANPVPQVAPAEAASGRRAPSVEPSAAAITAAAGPASSPDAPPQPDHQQEPEPNARQRCQEANQTSLTCSDTRTREEVATSFANDLGISVTSLECEEVESFGPGEIGACGLGPGQSWHCRVNDSEFVVSLFACVCCREDGSTSFEWRGPHPSPGPGNRPERRRHDTRRERRERSRERDRRRRELGDDENED